MLELQNGYMREPLVCVHAGHTKPTLHDPMHNLAFHRGLSTPIMLLKDRRLQEFELRLTWTGVAGDS